MLKKLFLIITGLTLSLSSSLFIKKESNKVELNSTILVSLKDYTDLSKDEEKYLFKQEIFHILGFNYQIVDEYNVVSNILKVKINSDDTKKISSLSSINYVQEDYLYSYDDEDVNYSMYNPDRKILETNYSSLAMNNTSQKLGENVLIAILDSAFNVDHESMSALSSSISKKYSKEDVENLYKSKSFNAKELNYVNSKVIFEYDYSMDDTSTLAKSTHGGHVASIAASNGTYKGIAPNSQLALMKVFNDNEGGCTSSIYIKALEDAYSLGADIVSMSFGTYLNSSLTGEDQAVEEVMKMMKNDGTIINVAAGNDGREFALGSDYEYQPLENSETKETSFLTESVNLNSIGSSALEEDESNVYGEVDGRSFRIYDRAKSIYGTSDEGKTYDYVEYKNRRLFYEYINNEEEYEFEVVPGYGEESDYSGINVKNKIAVVARGETYFSEKIWNAHKAGAAGLIIYNATKDQEISNFAYTIDDSVLKRCPDIPYINKNGTKYFDLSSINMPIALVTLTGGDILTSSESKKVSFYSKSISTFSSGGASSNLSLKPDLVAPGSTIYGAYIYLKENYQTDLYGYKNGTSMATPNASGAYAAVISELKEKYGEETSKIADKLIKSNTTLLKDEDGELVSPRLQGNGLINIDDAINSSFYLTSNDESKVELKNNSNIASGRIKFNLDINELEEINDTYEVNIKVLAPKISTLTKDDKEYEVKNRKDTLLIERNLGSLSLSENSTFEVDFSLPEETKEYLEKFENGTYLEGYVEVKSSKGETSSIAFLGYYGDYNSNVFEDYSFNKSENKLYESDLARDYVSRRYENEPFFGTYFLKGDGEGNYLDSIHSQNEMLNKYDILDGENDEGIDYVYSGTISDGDKGIIVQFFMLKNAVEGKVSISNEKGEVINTIDIKDTHAGLTKELYRSYILLQSSSLISSEDYLHLSYAYIPLYDKNSDAYFEKGKEYQFVFSFKLFTNETYVKKVTFKYDQEYFSFPHIVGMKEENGKLKFYIKEEDILSIKNSDNVLSFSKETYNNSTYTTFILDISLFDNDVYLEITNEEGGTISLKYFKDYDFIIAGPGVSNDLTLNIEKNNKNTYFSLDSSIFNKSNFIAIKTNSNSILKDSVSYIDFEYSENYIYFLSKDVYFDLYEYEDTISALILLAILVPTFILLSGGAVLVIVLVKISKKRKKL